MLIKTSFHSSIFSAASLDDVSSMFSDDLELMFRYFFTELPGLFSDRRSNHREIIKWLISLDRDRFHKIQNGLLRWIIESKCRPDLFTTGYEH
jgi:hypothetical protein